MSDKVDKTLFYKKRAAEDRQVRRVEGVATRHPSASYEPNNRRHSRLADTKVAAKAVLTLNEGTDDILIKDRTGAPAFSERRDVETPLVLDENQVLTPIEEEVPTTTRNATNRQDVRRPHSEPRRPTRGVRPGASAVCGPEGNRSDEHSVNTPNPTVDVAAEPVDADEENRIVNQRVQQALREERERAAIAHFVTSNADNLRNAPNSHNVPSNSRNVAPNSHNVALAEKSDKVKEILDPDGWLILLCVRWFGPRGRLLGVFSAILGITALIVWAVSSSRRTG